MKPTLELELTSSLYVLDELGSPHHLDSLWANRCIALILVRHFG